MNRRILRSIAPSFFSVLAGLLLGALVILMYGENPLTVYTEMILRPLSTYQNALNVLYVMTPLIVVGLAFVVAINAGMINLGLEGQLLLGSLAAAYTATLFPSLPWLLYVPLIMSVAMVVGALWASVPGYLKIRFGASEIVTCIMLNYVAQNIINYIISGGHFKHPDIAQRTPYILGNAHFTSLSEFGMSVGSTAFRGVQVNPMFLISLVLVVLIYVLVKHTTWGYKIRAVGLNQNATTANRMNTKKVMLMAMLLSGALAGIGATGEVLGTFNGFVEGFSPGYGFSGISVALLGRKHPIGVVFAALFFGVLDQGMLYVGANSAIPRDFVKIIQTAVIILIVLSPYLEEQWDRFVKTRAKHLRLQKAGAHD
jgi:simple sugar transport system permease protein